MWTQIKRIVRHRFAKAWRHYLPEAAMQRLTAQVAACEKLHSGEIRICIESRLPQSYLLGHAHMPAIVRRRALAQFSKLRVWDTEHNNGVLIYLLLPERAIELVADRGIDRRVAPGTWKTIVSSLGAELKNGRFEAGLQQAVALISAELTTHFAVQAWEGNRNELPNRPQVDNADQ
jgi:uncharacterized membrane protein